jgi:hypothetical protein
MRRIDNCNIIRGIVNTFLNGWDSGFPLCCILEFTFRSRIMYSDGRRMVSQFEPYRKVYDRDAKKTHNHYAACHLNNFAFLGAVIKSRLLLKLSVRRMSKNLRYDPNTETWDKHIIIVLTVIGWY